jgi:hypothetical protein
MQAGRERAKVTHDPSVTGVRSARRQLAGNLGRGQTAGFGPKRSGAPVCQATTLFYIHFGKLRAPRLYKASRCGRHRPWRIRAQLLPAIAWVVHTRSRVECGHGSAQRTTNAVHDVSTATSDDFDSASTLRTSDVDQASALSDGMRAGVGHY